MSQDSNYLADLAERVYAVNVANGWFDVNPRVEEFMAEVEDTKGIEDEDVIARIRALAIEFFGPRTFGDDMALLVSEASEALDAYRNWGLEDHTDAAREKNIRSVIAANPGMTYEKDAESIDHVMGLRKPEGVGSELADVLIRLVDTAKRQGIDLHAETERKLAFNATRGYKHGGKAL